MADGFGERWEHYAMTFKYWFVPGLVFLSRLHGCYSSETHVSLMQISLRMQRMPHEFLDLLAATFFSQTYADSSISKGVVTETHFRYQAPEFNKILSGLLVSFEHIST